MAIPHPPLRSLGELRRSGHRPRSLRQELRDDLTVDYLDGRRRTRR